MADQPQTARCHTDNFRECSCSSMTQLLTPQLLNNSAMRFGAETKSTFYVFIKESERFEHVEKVKRARREGDTVRLQQLLER